MYYLLSWSIMIDEIDHQPCHSTIYMQRTQNPKQRIQFVHWIRRKKLKNQILSGLITRNNEFIVLSFSENEKKKTEWKSIFYVVHLRVWTHKLILMRNSRFLIIVFFFCLIYSIVTLELDMINKPNANIYVLRFHVNHSLFVPSTTTNTFFDFNLNENDWWNVDGLY